VALHLEIVTPKGSVVAADAEEVYLPGKLGEFGILDGHIPFLSALKPGVVRYTAGGTQHQLAVGAGFAEVGAADKVLVLTDMHAFPNDVDLDATRHELEQAESELKAWTGELTVEHQELMDAVEWAQARLALSGKKPSK
jgi:F-type H+-transporting ATPase subunit epsilon